MTSKAGQTRLALVVQCANAIGTAIHSVLANEHWSVVMETSTAGASRDALSLLDPPSRNAHLVVLEVALGIEPLMWKTALGHAFDNAEPRALLGAEGDASGVVLVLDRRALVADANDPAYGIALAEVKAVARSHAMAVAPGLRLGVIVADLGSPDAPREIAAAVALVASSPAMTGFVIELE